MFGIGFPELVLIGVVALLVFGPDKLPEMAKTFGKVFGELKKNSDSLRREFYNSVYTPVQSIQDDLRKEMLEARKNLTTDKEQNPPAQHDSGQVAPESSSTNSSNKTSSTEHKVEP